MAREYRDRINQAAAGSAEERRGAAGVSSGVGSGGASPGYARRAAGAGRGAGQAAPAGKAPGARLPAVRRVPPEIRADLPVLHGPAQDHLQPAPAGPRGRRLRRACWSAIDFQRIAAIPLAALPIAAAVSLRLGVPFVYPRMVAKEHGTGNSIEGDFRPDDRVVLLDDVISTARSKLEAIEVLAREGLRITDLVVLVDRESGGREELERHGVRCHAYARISELLDLAAAREPQERWLKRQRPRRPPGDPGRAAGPAEGPGLKLGTVSGVLTTRPRLIEWADANLPEIELITTKSYQVRPNPGNREPILVEPQAGCFGNAVGLRNPGLSGGPAGAGGPAPQAGSCAACWPYPCPRTASRTSCCWPAASPAWPTCWSSTSPAPTPARGTARPSAPTPSTVRQFLQAIRRATPAPLFAKLTPNVADIGAIARAAVEAGADGIAAVNTVGPEVFREPLTGLPVLSNPNGHKGGKSGLWIREAALRAVAEIRRAVGPEVPILGMGGVATGEDARSLRGRGGRRGRHRQRPGPRRTPVPAARLPARPERRRGGRGHGKPKRFLAAPSRKWSTAPFRVSGGARPVRRPAAAAAGRGAGRAGRGVRLPVPARHRGEALLRGALLPPHLPGAAARGSSPRPCSAWRPAIGCGCAAPTGPPRR